MIEIQFLYSKGYVFHLAHTSSKSSLSFGAPDTLNETLPCKRTGQEMAAVLQKYLTISTLQKMRREILYAFFIFN